MFLPNILNSEFSTNILVFQKYNKRRHKEDEKFSFSEIIAIKSNLILYAIKIKINYLKYYNKLNKYIDHLNY